MHIQNLNSVSRQPLRNPKTSVYRSLKNLRQDRLLNDLSKVPWHITKISDEINDALHAFETLLTDEWDIHAPLKRKQFKQKPTPWMTSDLLKQIRKRNTLYSIFLKNRTDVSWMSYKQAQNYCTQAIRIAKRSFLLSLATNSRKFFKTMLECTGLGKKHRTTTAWPCSSPSSSKASGNMINSFFISSVNDITGRFKPSASEPIGDENILENAATTFKFSPFTERDVKEVISALKSPATNSLDKIFLHFLKLSPPVISATLADIFNLSLATATFPTAWEIAQVIPIFKKGNRQDIANYRPVSLLPLLSKVMEHIIDRQLCDYLEVSHLLHTSQHGFRRRRSCGTALLTLSCRLFRAKDKNQVTAMASLDYSKAFDTIDHDLLLSKLAKLYMSMSALSRIRSYLSHRQQYVLYNGTASDIVEITHGVPQGSILGPVLFLAYINDLLSSFDDLQALAYADDVSLVCHDDTKAEALAKLQLLLDKAYAWSVANLLCLNPSKCVSIFFHRWHAS